MTSTYDKDAFFDNDEDQGPNLTGEYNRGNTPPTYNLKQSLSHPSAGSSTSGHYSSDSNMSKSKGTPSRDALDSRSRSRSRSPSGSSHRYSDSFDSEASGDSRSRSRSRSTRGGKKSGGVTPRRFDSGTSRDSRSTFRSYNSSVYGKSNKKGQQKPQQKKGRGRGRASSIASSTQNTPRGNNGSETTRRMLSAKGHTINRLRNEYEVLKSKHDELQREFKLQKQIHKKNERELNRYTHQEEQLPTLMKAQNAEVDHYRKKCQAYREKERQKDQRLKQYNDKLNRAEDELRRARDILENKGLKERADLQKEVDRLDERVQEKEQKLEELEKYISNMKKNQRHERRDWKSHEKEYKGQIEQLHMENEKLQVQLREKEKELDIKNIYSNRIVKPPGRFRTNSHSPTPTSLRPIMYHKSTTTDEIILNSTPRHPHPPETRRANSAEDRTALETNISRTKSPRDERYRRKADEQRQKSQERTEAKEEQVVKKELSESERILMELDSGIKKPEEKKPPQEEDETDRILRQFDNNNKITGNSLRQQQAEEERRREEERKRQEKLREEEERRRREKEEEERKRKEEEEKKPQWLKGATSSSSSSGYSPSAFGNAATRQARSQSQHKAATSKLPWLAADSPVHKPEQERKEKEQDAKLTNESAESPRRTPTLKTSEDEEDYPFFGSKPAEAKLATNTAKQQPFAVSSIKDLQKYSAQRESNSPTSKPDYNGLFANPGHTAFKDDAKSEREKQEQEAKEEEERRKKDLLLARMRDIDDGKKPDSGQSRKSYNHTDPVKNMHNGLPSHPDLAKKERRKSIDDDLTFGSYAPSFTSGGGAKPAVKATPKKKNPFFDNDSDGGFTASPKQSPQRVAKKNNLMADLFGSGSEKSENPSRSSFGDDNVFSSSTKAKPVADTGVYPWEKKVSVGQGNTNKPNGGIPGAGQKKAVPVTSFSDDFDDDLEEMTL